MDNMQFECSPSLDNHLLGNNMCSGNKEIEYSEVMGSIRHIVDYRAKVFNLTIVLNAALIVIVLQHIKNLEAQLSVATLALSTTVILSLIDRKISAIIDLYFYQARKIEKELGFSTMNVVIRLTQYSKFNIRNYFQWLYFLLSGLWIVHLYGFAEVHLTNG